MDSVLLGAAVASGRRTLLDLGAGVGTAAMVALAHHPGLAATLVENHADTVRLARQNLADNQLVARAVVIEADVVGPGAARLAAGIGADSFDVVIANPPFFAGERGTAPAAARAAARHMHEGALDRWLATAAMHAAPDGEVVVIHAAAELPALLAALGARFGAVTVLPLLPRAGEPASRVLVRGIKGSRAPFALLAGRALHEPDGRAFRPEFDAIFRGTARLIW